MPEDPAHVHVQAALRMTGELMSDPSAVTRYVGTSLEPLANVIAKQLEEAREAAVALMFSKAGFPPAA